MTDLFENIECQRKVCVRHLTSTSKTLMSFKGNIHGTKIRSTMTSPMTRPTIDQSQVWEP